ncbi:MAG: hypothetical protein HC923_12395 [Myxococcales bacterium]|nr:hypothetical protein [Myxococcales bacterium]
MDQEALVRELGLLSRAGYPFLYVLTHEERRALHLIQAVAGSSREVHRWTRSTGLRLSGAEVVPDSREPLAALVPSKASRVPPSSSFSTRIRTCRTRSSFAA